MEAKTIVVLGGGVGGVVTARQLRKRLPRRHRVILIDRERQHVFAPSLLWLMVGMRKPQNIQRPLQRLKRKGIEVLEGNIEKIDAALRSVTVNGSEIRADYIVVSLGAELQPGAVKGLAESGGHNFYTLAGAESLQKALSNLEGGRVIVLTAAPAYKCPAAPYEAALLIRDYFKRGKPGQRIEVEVYAAELGPMGVAGPEVSSAVKQMLSDASIPYYPEHQIDSVNAANKEIRFTNGKSANYDVLAYVPPHRAPAVVRESGLTSDSGWISVDRHSLKTKYPYIYALGDVVSIPLAMGKPLPKAGVFAHSEALVVARNIAAEIRNRVPSHTFNGNGECFIEIGGGKAGFGGGDFYAEPKPAVKLKAPSWRWHAAKVLFEKFWLNCTL